MKFSLAALTLALCVTLGGLAAKAEEAPLTPAQVEALVKKVIADNPELIVKSLQAYETREHAMALSKASQNLKSSQGDLKKDSASPVAGNPDGDITLVEFFDYHCGYCKRFLPTLNQLLDEDKNVRVVFKEFPILAEDSAVAAKAALAVYSIDKSKYLPYHTALMQASGAFTPDMLAEKAKDIGIDKAAFDKAFKDPAVAKELERNKALAQSLGISGTPTLIIGTQFVPGAIGIEELKQKIAEARKEAKK